MSRKVEEIVLKVSIQDNKADAKLDKMMRGGKKVDRQFDKTNTTLRKFQKEAMKGGNQAVMFYNRVNASAQKWKRNAKELEDQQRRNKESFDNMKIAGIAFAYMLVRLGQTATDVTMKFDRMRNSMNSVFGDNKKAGEEIEFLSQVSEHYGLNLLKVSSAYTKLSASTRNTLLEGQETRDLFLGVAEASTALSLSADDTEGIMRALEQMMSKGTVQAEELKLQLGDRLPATLELASRALGTTRAEMMKMMENGEVMAEDFLPKFGKVLREEFGEGATKASESATANWNRMNNAMDRFFLVAGEQVVKILPVMTDLIDNLTHALKPLLTVVGAVVEKFVQMQNAIEGGILKIIAVFDKEVRDNLDGIDYTANNVNKTFEQMRKLADQSTKSQMRMRREKEKLNQTDKEHIKLVQDMIRAENKAKLQKMTGGLLGESAQSFLDPKIDAMLKDGKRLSVISRQILQDFKDFNLEAMNLADNIKGNEKRWKEFEKTIGKSSELNWDETVFGENFVENPFGNLINDAKELKSLMNFTKELGLNKKMLDKLGIGTIKQALDAGMSEEMIRSSINALIDTGFFGGQELSSPRENLIERGVSSTQYLQELAHDMEKDQLDYLKKISENTAPKFNEHQFIGG